MKERKQKCKKLGMNKGESTNAEKNPVYIGEYFAQHCVSNFESMDAMYDFQKKT